jgi:hypothetical protein
MVGERGIILNGWGLYNDNASYVLSKYSIKYSFE